MEGRMAGRLGGEWNSTWIHLIELPEEVERRGRYIVPGAYWLNSMKMTEFLQLKKNVNLHIQTVHKSLSENSKYKFSHAIGPL